MGKPFRFFVLCLISFISYINGQKTYIPDEDGVKGVSNSWIVPGKSKCSNSPWNFHGPSINNEFPYFGVCSSNNCLLQTASYTVKNVGVVYAEIYFVGTYCKTSTTPTTGKIKLCTEFINVNANLFDVPSINGQTTETAIKVPSSDTFKIKLDMLNS